MLINVTGKKVIVCENVIMATVVKVTIEKVLKTQFKVESVFFVDSSLLACLAFGKKTGISVCIGHYETIIVPVFDGSPLLTLVKFARIGGFQAASVTNYSNPANENLDDKLLSENNLVYFKDGNEDGLTVANLILQTLAKVYSYIYSYIYLTGFLDNQLFFLVSH